MIRVERNKAADLDVQFYVDGTLTNATGNVTVTITRADGSALVTDAVMTNPSVGVYRYALAPQANLNRFTLVATGTWSGSVQSETVYVEIVGDFYVTLAAIRALPNLSDTAKFPNAKLSDARQWFETTFEAATGVAWVPRFARDRVSGDGRGALMLPHWPVRLDPLTGRPAVYSVRTYSAAATYTSYDSTALADLTLDGSALRRVDGTTFTTGTRNIVVEYEHGFDGPPADVLEAAKVAIRDRLLDQNIGNRVFGVSTQDGIVRTSTPGPERPFGIPSVDAVVAANNHRIPGVA